MTNFSPLNRAVSASMDDELTTEARLLAHKAIAVALHYLDHGSPVMQLNVIKSIMPAIGRGLSDKGESEELALMREELHKLHVLIVGAEVA